MQIGTKIREIALNSRKIECKSSAKFALDLHSICIRFSWFSLESYEIPIGSTWTCIQCRSESLTIPSVFIQYCCTCAQVACKSTAHQVQIQCISCTGCALALHIECSSSVAFTAALRLVFIRLHIVWCGGVYSWFSIECWNNNQRLLVVAFLCDARTSLCTSSGTAGFHFWTRDGSRGSWFGLRIWS